MMRNVCKETRKSNKLTQEEFAEKLNVTRQTVIRWEKSPDTIPLNSMVRILTLSTEEAV